MARTTDNYELPFEDDRYVSVEAMLRVALQKLDAIVKSIDDRVVADEAAIVDHETRIADLESV